MPSRAALFTKHRPIALGIAKLYYFPGYDADDVRQEAMVALWEATAVYDPARGFFPALAKVVIHRHLQDLVTAANRQKRKAVHVEFYDRPDVKDRIAARLKLLDLSRVHLTPRERQAIGDHLDGVSARGNKPHDNALQRARKKLQKEA